MRCQEAWSWGWLSSAVAVGALVTLSQMSSFLITVPEMREGFIKAQLWRHCGRVELVTLASGKDGQTTALVIYLFLETLSQTHPEVCFTPLGCLIPVRATVKINYPGDSSQLLMCHLFLILFNFFQGAARFSWAEKSQPVYKRCLCLS